MPTKNLVMQDKIYTAYKVNDRDALSGLKLYNKKQKHLWNVLRNVLMRMQRSKWCFLYINGQHAKFITGTKSLDTMEDYYQLNGDLMSPLYKG